MPLNKFTLTCLVSDRPENPAQQPRNVCLLSWWQFHVVITCIHSITYMYTEILHTEWQRHVSMFFLFKCIVSHRWSRTVRTYALLRRWHPFGHPMETTNNGGWPMTALRILSTSSEPITENGVGLTGPRQHPQYHRTMWGTWSNGGAEKPDSQGEVDKCFAI